jgi:putative endopeptidase
VGDDLYTNGKLVLGESISDLGDVALAYQAYQKSMAGKPRPPAIDGFTAEQRFFLGFAQVWGGSVRLEFVRLLTATNPHPLSRLRVNGPLSNLEIFARAFGCKGGDPMVRPAGERCRVW